MDRPRALANGGIDLGPVVIPSREIHVRATTSGGPGGQHANRTLSRIVVSFDVARAESLDQDSRQRLVERLGSLVSASASGSRSQAQNRQMALERLARKLADGLHEDPHRRATRPTRSSVQRRLEDKTRRAKVKEQRRHRDDD